MVLIYRIVFYAVHSYGTFTCHCSSGKSEITVFVNIFPYALGGDIFVHAKSNTPSKLFELCQKVMGSLPADSVQSFEDIYSFVYQNGRDLSGFIDGNSKLC